MVKKSALEKIESHEKLCRIMQKQTFEQMKEMREKLEKDQSSYRRVVSKVALPEQKEEGK